MTITILPLGVATIVASFIFCNIFTVSDGYMNSFLQLFGLPSVNWYSSYGSKMLLLILSDSWKNSPIVAMIILAGMTGSSPELYHAAAIDSSGHVRRCLS